MAGNAGDGRTVGQLGFEHALLYRARQQENQGQHGRERNGQARAARQDDGHDADYPAYVGKHADHARGKQRFDGIHIAREPGYDRAGIGGGKLVRAHGGQLALQPCAHGVRNLLAKHGQQALAR